MFAQNDSKELTQTIRGVVTDKAAGKPLPAMTVLLDATRTGTTTDEKGMFVLAHVPIGRHTIYVSGIAYENAIIKEV